MTDTQKQASVVPAVLAFLGVIAIIAGGVVFLSSRQTTMEDEAADVVRAIENLERAKTGEEPLPMPNRDGNMPALVGGLAVGGVLLIAALITGSNDRRHRETLAAIAAQTPAGEAPPQP